MKTVLKGLVIVLIALPILAAFAYLYKKSQSKPVVWQTETAEVTDIIKKTVATGSIVPRREVEVKPKVTGVLKELYVEPGKLVKEGDPLGKIAIVPDASPASARRRAAAGIPAAMSAIEAPVARASGATASMYCSASTLVGARIAT